MPARNGAPRGARRFYDSVALGPSEAGEDWATIRLGSRTLSTRKGALWAAPRRLAALAAAEWDRQNEWIIEADLPLTWLIGAWRDDPAGLAQWGRGELARFAESDLLTYWPAEDARLRARCEAQWGPMLAWTAETFGAPLNVATGVSFAGQPEASLTALARAAAALDPLVLGAAGRLAGLYGSAVLALGVAHGRLDAATAFALSRLDETAQAEIWGLDAEAEARTAALAALAQAFGAVIAAR